MASSSSHTLWVRPIGWENAAPSERFELSDMDHTMPKIYVQIAEVFEMPNEASQESILEYLKAGLELSLSQFTILAGSLHMDETNGRLWVTKKNNSSVGLYVKQATNSEDLPSYEYLAKNDFPVHLLDGNKVLPKAVTEKQLFSPMGDNAEEDLIISAFQVTFINGGLILAAAIHHSCSDGTGCNGFLSTWAHSSAAAKFGTAFRILDRQSLDRGRLSAAKPSPSRWAELDGKFKILKDLGGPPPAPPADFKMPTLKVRMWHFPKSKMAKLKADASAGLGDTWISTYDATMALLWRTITRARIPLLKPDMASESILAHGLNTRGKVEPPLADQFMGNAVALPRTESIAIQDIIAEDSLPRMAAAVRQSTQTITKQYVSELPEWVAGLEDRRWITVDMNSFLGLDLAGTSWQSMTPYIDHDFGFGLPKAVRWPHPQFEGYVFVLPSRTGVKPQGNDEGTEVIVCLEESCQNRLLHDEELLQYGQPRGHKA